MKLFLQIELRNWQESAYEKPWLAYASSLANDLIGAEIDNQSEASIADLVIRLVDQAQSVFIFIVATPKQPFGVTLKLINHLLRSQGKIFKILLSGHHEGIERLLHPIDSKFLIESDPEKIKSEIRLFALT